MKKTEISKGYAKLLKCCAHGNVKEWIREECGKETTLYKIELCSEKELISLIWHEIDATRLLTPDGKPRTIADVVDRMIGTEEYNTFEKLTQNLKLPSNEHCPEWFEPCVDIYNNFNANKFRKPRIWFRPATCAERDQSPSGTYYIFDGSHRTLAFAKLLRDNKGEYQPIQAILIECEQGKNLHS